MIKDNRIDGPKKDQTPHSIHRSFMCYASVILAFFCPFCSSRTYKPLPIFMSFYITIPTIKTSSSSLFFVWLLTPLSTSQLISSEPFFGHSASNSPQMTTTLPCPRYSQDAPMHQQHEHRPKLLMEKLSVGPAVWVLTNPSSDSDVPSILRTSALFRCPVLVYSEHL